MEGVKIESLWAYSPTLLILHEWEKINCNSGDITKRTIRALNRQYIEQLPIRPTRPTRPTRLIDFSDPTDAARHDRMVALVQRMLDLHKQLAATSLPHSRELLQRQIDATDRQIDRLVYELYGLSAAEIGIVEGRVGG